MFQYKLLLIIVYFFGLSTAFAQRPFGYKTKGDSALRVAVRESMFGESAKVRPDSAFDKALRLGELDALLMAVPNRSDLQLERLAAYFFHQRINVFLWNKNFNFNKHEIPP